MSGLGLGLNLSLGNRGGGGIDVSAKTQAYLNGIAANGGTLPSGDALVALNTFINTLDTAGVWAKLSCLYISVKDAAGSLVNAINPNVAATKINAGTDNITFSEYLGWTGATEEGINTKINLSTDAKYKDGNGTMFGFITSPITASAAQYVLGSRTSSTANCNIIGLHPTLISGLPSYICPQYTANIAQGLSGAGLLDTDKSRSGLLCVTDNGTNSLLSKNGTQIASVAMAGRDVSKIAIAEVAFCGVINTYTSTIVGNVTSGRIAVVGIGGGLTVSDNPATSTDTKTLYEAIDAFYVAMGVSPVWR